MVDVGMVKKVIKAVKKIYSDNNEIMQILEGELNVCVPNFGNQDLFIIEFKYHSYGCSKCIKVISQSIYFIEIDEYDERSEKVLLKYKSYDDLLKKAEIEDNDAISLKRLSILMKNINGEKILGRQYDIIYESPRTKNIDDNHLLVEVKSVVEELYARMSKSALLSNNTMVSVYAMEHSKIEPLYMEQFTYDKALYKHGDEKIKKMRLKTVYRSNKTKTIIESYIYESDDMQSNQFTNLINRDTKRIKN